jgi:hypothetical protein
MSAQPKAAGLGDVPDDGEAVVQQALRREANERLAALDGTGRGADWPMDVCCECARSGCTGRVAMTVAEYEAIRRFPTRFLVKEGHGAGAGDRVVGGAAGYVVVEKSGRQGLYAVGADPRRRVRRRAATRPIPGVPRDES